MTELTPQQLKEQEIRMQGSANPNPPIEPKTKIEFFIPGLPAPAGSKKAFALRNKSGLMLRPNGSPVVVVTDAGGKATKEWKQQVAVFARQAYQGAPLTGPLRVTFEFFRTRPKAHFKSNGTVKDNALNLYPVTKPDATKLIRAAEDAMTGIIWVDDAQIVKQIASKDYSDTPGLKMTIEAL